MKKLLSFSTLCILLLLILTSLIYADTTTVTDSSESVLAEPLDLNEIPLSDTLRIPELDLNNNDIRNVLRGIGMQYGLNIFLEPQVTGNVSLFLTDISVKDAVKFIISQQGYEYRVNNSIVTVYKPVAAPVIIPEPTVTFSLNDSLLSVDFKDLSVTDVARMFVDSAGVNVILEGGHSKVISGKLINLPITQTIQTLFTSNGFEVNESDGIYYVNTAWSEPSSNGRGGGSQQNNSFRRVSVVVDSNKNVSFEVNNASIDDLVRNIILETGLNIIVYDRIQGTITAKCDATPLDDILRFLLQNTDYTFWKSNDIYFIGSREMSQQKTTTVIPLQNIRSEESVIGPLIPARLSRTAVINYDSEHNSLIVTGSFDVVQEVKEFIKTIDIPIPQVLIEALVVDFNVSNIRSVGVSMFMGGGNEDPGFWGQEQYLPGLDLKPGVGRITDVINNVLSVTGSNKIVTLPADFRIHLEALETASMVKVQSTPQIATVSGNPASITIGETRYYKLLKETTSPNMTGDAVIGTDERFEEKKFNTVLQVTPWVMADSQVIIEINPEFNIPRLGGDESVPPTTDTRVIESMVRLRHNETIVLGGYRATEEVESSKGVPFLSSIPILGYLFKSSSNSNTETQMMIFLTPRIYYGNDVSVEHDDYFGRQVEDALRELHPNREDEQEAAEDAERQARRDARDAEREAEAAAREAERLEELEESEESDDSEQQDSDTQESSRINSVDDDDLTDG